MAKQQSPQEPDNSSFKEQRDILSEINAELGKQINNVKEASKSYSELGSIAAKLQNSEEEISKLSGKQLQALKEKSQIALRELKAAAERLQKEKGITDLSAKALKKRKDLTTNERSLLTAASERFQVEENFVEQVGKELEQYEKITQQLGVFGGVLKGLSKIPLIGDVFDANQALDAARDKVKETGSGVAGLASGFKNIGSQIFKGVLNPSNMLLTATTLILDTFLELDNSAENYARSMNITYEEALKVRNEMSAVAGITKGQMMEASIAINKELGTSAALTQENAAAFAELQVYAGMTADELMGITSLSLTNGKNIKQNTNEFIAQAKEIAAGKGLVLNEKQLMADIGKISKATTLSLGKNPKELAKAVATAKALGMEMGKLEDIAGGLLDFESSIENELSAELLTGKNLNLEKARQLALNNDIAGMAEEINNQIGTSADYTKMNRIQQEALAKSVGMNREELAQTLYTQEQLKGLTGKEAEEKQALLDQRIEEVGLAQAKKEIEEGSFNKLKDQAGIQTKFNEMMLELKDTLANGILPLFIPMADFLTKNVGLVKTLLLTYIGIKGVMLATNIIQTAGILLAKKKKKEEVKDATVNVIGNSYKMAGGLGPLGIAVVAGLIGAGIGALAMYAADDMLSPAPGGSGYGKRTLFGPEGAIQLNDKDTVIAGTNLFGDDVKSEPGKTTKMGSQGDIKIKADGGNMSAVVDAIIELRRDINALASRPINVSMDGKKVIEATTGNQPNTTGEESRKNSYRVS